MRDRVLLGPGPSPVPPRVMRAMARPVIGHLDPQLLSLLDEIRTKLAALFRARPDAFTIAISGTGTAGMEAAVATLVPEGARCTVVVTGYFGERLAEMCRRYGGRVTRVDAEWGRAADPAALRRTLRAQGADVVAAVHAETSTGVLNPIEALAEVAREHGALTIVDTVTSLGAMPVDAGAWALDACYSCTQKGLGAPSGLAPLTIAPNAMNPTGRRAPARSFYLDLALLEDYWIRRKYHHTISAPLLYALHEALCAIEEEGIDARWARHERHHHAFAAGLRAMGLSLLPPEGERLWTLHAVRVPEGVDDAGVRRHLLDQFSIEIGAGLGPLAGRIWRIGLMGAGSTRETVLLCLAALEHALRACAFRLQPGAGVAAAIERLT